MEIKRYENATLFLNDIESFLLRDEYMNNLMLGLLYRMKDKPNNQNDLFLSITHQENQLILMMSGLYVILYANTTDQILYFEAVNYLIVNQIDYPGIIGPNVFCQAFAKAYKEITHKSLTLKMNQRIFVNKEVKHISNVKAKIIPANHHYDTILTDWMYDFMQETLESPTRKSAKEKVDMLIETKGLYLLKTDDKIVSMAASTRPFRQGISVGYVYTPLEYRNQGYATMCVERLTKKLLTKYDYCTLYTDLANPTSNSIYQKIGYKPIGDSVLYMK